MAKTKAIYWTSMFGILAYAHIAKPDDEAPKGASWKPDGKFKGTLVVDGDTDLAELQDKCLEALHAEFGQSIPAVEDLKLPFKAGEKEDLQGKMLIEAKSQYRPAIYDATGGKAPAGVFPKSGDEVRFNVSLYPFSKEETVIEKVNGKKVEKKEKIFGVSLRLGGVQIVRRGAGGGGGFGAVEGGYVASEEDRMPDATGGEEGAKRERRAPAASGDF